MRVEKIILPQPMPLISPRSRKGRPRSESMFDGREDEVRQLAPLMSLSQLSAHFKCSEIAISRIKKKLGIRSAGRIVTKGKFISARDEFLDLHNTMPDSQLASHFGVYQGTIEKWRVRLGIKKTANRWDLSPHPRGALGITLSADARAKISLKSSAWWASRTDDERADKIVRGMKTRAKNGTLYPPRNAATWMAGWRQIGSQRIYCRSAWEANFGRYLEWLRATGHIESWSHEPKTFWFDAPKKTIDGRYLTGVRRGVVSYLPDFVVVEKNGAEIYYEVKGWMDDRSKTKLSRMAIYYPEIKVILIDSKHYKAIEKDVLGLIPEWERKRAEARTEITVSEIVGAEVMA